VTLAGPAATAAGFALVAALLGPVRASGAPLDAVAAEAAALEARLDQVEKTYTRPDETATARARRQYAEGEIQFLLGDWLYAAVLMYGALDEPGFRASPDGPRALLYLGDALRSRGAFGAARAAYDELLGRGVPALEAPALVGALACRLKLRQLDGVQPLLEAARARLGSGSPPELAYLVGKATYFRPDLRPAERLEQGLADFGAVTRPHHLAAAYFQGVLRVDAGQLDAAAERFEACVKLEGTEPAQVEVRELCAMAAARVYAEQRKFAESLDRYQLVPYASPRFNESLHEVAWGYIRAGRFDLALRTATIIVDLAPESPLAPEATILTGHLELRLNQFTLAGEAFKKVIDTYAPIRDQLDAILASQEDPVGYLNDLIARQGTAFDVASVLPPMAVKWATAQQAVAGALDLVASVDTARQDLADSRHVLGRIEGLLVRSGGLDTVPLARDGWINADAMLNGTTWLRGLLADQAAERVAARLAPAAAAELQRLREARQALQPRLEALPRTTGAVEARARRMRGRVDQADKAVFLLGRQADAAGSAVAGAEAWLARNRGDSHGDPAFTAELGAELASHRAVVSGYQGELRSLRQEIAEARDTVGGTAQAAGDAELRAEYLALLAQERALLAPQEAAASPAEAEAQVRAGALAARLDRADADAERLKAEFAAAGGRGAVAVARRIAAERAELELQEAQLAAVAEDAKDIIGRIAVRSFGLVRAQFDRLVLKAEVGQLDVAWSRKRERVETMQRLTQQKDASLQAFERDLRRLLREIE
jgi:hypothetical protein